MEEAFIKKVQPHNLEAEQSVIGAMLMDRDAIQDVVDIISMEDFYQNSYGILYQAMVALYNEGKPVDLVTLSNKLKDMGAPENISSLDYIREIVSAVPTSANAKQYAMIVQEKSLLRHMIKFNDDINQQCYLGKEDVDTLLENAEKEVFRMVQTRHGSDDITPIRNVVMNVINNIEEMSKTSGRVTGLPSGFVDLDNKLTGFHPSELILVAARPAMGKTAFVLNIAHHVAVKEKKGVAIFSLEMSKEQLVQRMIAIDSKVDSQDIRTGKMQGSDWSKVVESAVDIGDSHLFIDDTSGITVSELRSKCRKLKQQHDIQLIIIDYLQLMGGGKRSESRTQEISEISRTLKVMARELNVPVIALSQLNRAVETREEKIPKLSDLRESGSIEQDADVVMFIYRDEYYKKDESEKKGIADIIVAKQRNGSTGTVELVWLGKYTKFANKER